MKCLNIILNTYQVHKSLKSQTYFADIFSLILPSFCEKTIEDFEKTMCFKVDQTETISDFKIFPTKLLDQYFTGKRQKIKRHRFTQNLRKMIVPESFR